MQRCNCIVASCTLAKNAIWKHSGSRKDLKLTFDLVLSPPYGPVSDLYKKIYLTFLSNTQ